jgi:hypothetical protein
MGRRRGVHDAHVLLAQGVLDRDADVVKRDVGRASRLGVARRHLLGLDALLSGDEDDGQAAVGPAADLEREGREDVVSRLFTRKQERERGDGP